MVTTVFAILFVMPLLVRRTSSRREREQNWDAESAS
jgi:hypothetical protein